MFEDGVKVVGAGETTIARDFVDGRKVLSLSLYLLSAERSRYTSEEMQWWKKHMGLFASPEATRSVMKVPVSPLGWDTVPATVTRIL